MNFLNDKIVKIVPKAMGNADSDCPSAFFVEKLSARGFSKYAVTVKDKDIRTDADLFCLIVSKIENCFLEDPETGKMKEVTTPEEFVDIPGTSPIVGEVVLKFGEINGLSGDSKNA